MELTDCISYGSECNYCNTTEAIPNCYKSRYERCEQCGRGFDIDIGCIHCEH